MTTLSSSPLFTPTPSLPLEGRVAFFGRTLRDYNEIFGLSTTDLAGRTVLDVAAGPSSFCLEATLAGAAVVAADPLYRLNDEGLSDRFRRDYAAVRASVAAHEERYENARERERLFARRRRAAALFLGDLAAGRAAGRYRAEALPQLSFGDRQFDTVLCGHFLFLYAHQFDERFHLEACRELCRVARREVRLYPLSGFTAAPVPFLETLRQALARVGIRSRLENLTSPMLKSAGQRLVLFPSES